MQNISVTRFASHPRGYQGVLRPEDGRWQLILDAEGIPHLFVRVFVDDQPGWLNIEDLLPSHNETGVPLMISDLIDGVAGPSDLPPDEEAVIAEEYALHPHVCPV